MAVGVLVMRDPLQTVEILALPAVLCILAGLLLLAWPGMTLTALIWIVGLWLITRGLVTTAPALWIRHADDR